MDIAGFASALPDSVVNPQKPAPELGQEAFNRDFDAIWNARIDAACTAFLALPETRNAMGAILMGRQPGPLLQLLARAFGAGGEVACQLLGEMLSYSEPVEPQQPSPAEAKPRPARVGPPTTWRTEA